MKVKVERATRWALLVVLLQGCLGGETEIVQRGGSADAAAAGGGGGGGAGGGAGGGGGGGSGWPDDRCDIDVDLDTLDGWEAAGDRWTVEDGRVAATAGGVSGLLLRGREETCSDTETSVTFVAAPGAYPLLVARVGEGGGWYGVGYDGRYGAVVLLSGNGAETGETAAPLDFVDVDPGKPYRLSLRVVDDALVGALFEGDGARPLSVLHGPAPARPGPGRVGLLEVAGGAVRFERFRAAPVARGDGVAIDSARVVAPDTLVVTTGPRDGGPLIVDWVPGGLSLHVGEVEVALTDVAPRPGTAGELLLTADAFLRGADDVTLTHTGDGAISRHDATLPATTVRVDNLLWSDADFTPYTEDFDGEGLGAGWAADAPEAFAAGRGGLTITPQGRYGEKAWLRRPTAEAHVDSTVTADFSFDDRPRREAERTTVIVALRARSAVNAHYQAAFGYGDFDANLAIRVMNRDGFTSDLATVPVDRAAAAPGAPLRLEFSASGPLLWASLYRLDADGPTLLAATSVAHRQVPGPGPVALGARGHGTVRFDRVKVTPAEAPPPRIAAASVPASDPNRIDVAIEAASALRGIGPAGFQVVAGEVRAVAAATRTPDGLALRLDGPPLQAGQRVFVSYDAATGRVSDSGQPRSQSLLGVDRFPVRNDAPPAPVLALAHARLVTPDTLDLVVTDSGALPVRVSGTDGLSVRLKGRPAAILAARPLAGVRDVVRVSFEAEVAPGDPVEVTHEGRAVADGGGQALRPFTGAPAENGLEAPLETTPQGDDFTRADGPPGGGWEPRTPALWAIEAGALRYTADAGADGRILLHPQSSRARYRTSVTVRAAPFREGFEEPTASLFGSYVGVNPANPEEYFDVRLQLNFATGDVSLIGQFNAPVAGTRLEAPPAPEEAVRLVLEVNGRAAQGRVEALDGRVLATLAWFLPMEAPMGRPGLVGGAAGTVYFDDWQLVAPEARPPWTQVLSTRLTAAAPNDVRVEVGTPSGRVFTGGAGDGWTVRVDGAARRVEGVQVSGRALLVRFAGAPVSARQRVTIAYDARRGDVHDGSDPVPFPLETLPTVPVVNQAAVGADLFVVAAEAVDPWSVDLVFNGEAALPAAPEAAAHEAFTVRAGADEIAVRELVALPARDARLRLRLAEPIAAGAAVRVSYAPGTAGARVLDARGGELQPPLEVAAAPLGAPAAFAPFADDFDGPGINFAAGWTPDPAESWVRDRGDALFQRQDFREGNSLLRPEGEAREDVRITTRVRVDAPPLSFVAAGAVARVGPEGGYRGWYAGADGLTPVLRVERLGPFGGAVLAQAPMPRLNANSTYDFDFLVQGAFVRLEVRRGDEVVGLVGAVDPGAPLPPGRVGLVAQGAGTARFSDVGVEPAPGRRASVVAIRATVFNYAPDTVAVDVAAARPLLYADGRGFRVTVNGAPRVAAGVTLEAARVLLRLDGPPLQAEDDVRVAFDAAAGLVVDDGEVPQPLGPFAALRARMSAPPLLASTTVIGRNLVELTYATEGLPLELEGDGGLQVWVAHADLGPAPVRLGLIDVWPDPLRDGDTLLLATAEAIPRRAQVTIVSAPGPGNRLTDVGGVEPAPLDLPVTAAAARTQADVAAPAVYDAVWGGDEPSGWRYYGQRPDRFAEEEGALVATGSGVLNEATSALAPAATAEADVKVTADFRLEEVDAPLGRHAFPRVDVRGFNDDVWVGCFVRNDRALLPARDDGGRFEVVEDASPALVCATQNGDAEQTTFEACRMQFYEASADGGHVRYDWAARWLDEHRLVVKVRGRRLRAELYNLTQRDAGQPRLVAVSEVPDIGDRAAALGLAGVGLFDSGRVRFTSFRVEALGADDLPALDERWAPTGDCR